MTVPPQDPFYDPAPVASTFPSTESLRGRLVMITPRKVETVPNRQNPALTNERVTADVTVVDGLGPVPVFRNYAPTGQTLEGPDFTGVYFSGSRMVTQLTPFIGTGRAVLGIVDTYQPGTRQGQGNPWGIVPATDEQKTHARNFLASRTIGAAATPPPAPAPVQAPPAYAAPVAAQQAPASVPQYQTPPPVQAPPAVAPAAVPAVNPFAAPPAQAGPVPQGNPFA